MPSKRITRIEFPVKLPAPAQPQPRKRVAAYARVSTMKDAQENSLQSQQDYFAEYIRHHPDWVFVGIYTGDGISGLSIRRRDGFNRMVDDALDRKIGRSVQIPFGCLRFRHTSQLFCMVGAADFEVRPVWWIYRNPFL